MSKHADFRKSLKRPDEFQRLGASFLERLYEARALLTALVATIALVIGGVWGWSYYQSLQKTKVEAELAKIETDYAMAEQAVDKQREEISKELMSMLDLGGLAGTEKDKKKLSEDEKKKKREELEAKMRALKPDQSALLPRYQEFAKKYPSYVYSAFAHMRAAQILLAKNQFKEARDTLEKMTQDPKLQAFYQVQGGFMLAELYEQTGEIDKGLATLNRIEPRIEKDLKPQLLFAKGRMLMEKKSNDEAKKVFEAIVKDHPSSQQASASASILALRLGG